MILLKRIYDDDSRPGEFRLLVDGLWPRGLRKADVKADQWLKEIAPSSALRKWFDHDPSKWKSFREKYTKELESKTELLKRIKQLEQEHKQITLLYAARDKEHNNAVVLKEVLDSYPAETHLK